MMRRICSPASARSVYTRVQGDAIGAANGKNPTLTVVATCILAFQGRPVEHLRGELEVKAPRSEVAIAFSCIPPEAHRVSIRLYIRRRNVVVGLTTPNQPRAVGVTRCVGCIWMLASVCY